MLQLNMLLDHVKKILILTYFHMRSRYRRALAGFLWVIANPILTFLIQSFVFKSVLKINLENYNLFLLAGLLPWFFISQSLYVISNCLVTSRDLLLAFKIHPLDIISSQVIDQFFSFFAAFFFIVIIFLSDDFSKFYGLNTIFLAFSIIILFVFVILLTALISFWQVFYRDVQFITQFVTNLAFYITPIFYPKDFIPTKFQWIIKFNIFVPIVNLFQNSLYHFDLDKWIINCQNSLIIIFALSLMVYLSFKTKMKAFYINV